MFRSSALAQWYVSCLARQALRVRRGRLFQAATSSAASIPVARPARRSHNSRLLPDRDLLTLQPGPPAWPSFWTASPSTCSVCCASAKRCRRLRLKPLKPFRRFRLKRSSPLRATSGRCAWTVPLSKAAAHRELQATNSEGRTLESFRARRYLSST